MARGTDTRQQLVEAVIELLGSGGESAIRMHDVAKRVGIREPSIYHYFPNREALVNEAQITRYRAGLVALLDVFDDAVQRATTAEDFLRVVAATMATACDPTRGLLRQMRLNVIGNALLRPELLDVIVVEQRNANERLAGALAPAQAKGWIQRDRDLPTTAAWIFGVLLGRVLIEIDPPSTNPEAWDALAINAVVEALRPRAERNGG